MARGQPREHQRGRARPRRPGADCRVRRALARGRGRAAHAQGAPLGGGWREGMERAVGRDPACQHRQESRQGQGARLGG
eukprot:7443279-Pyramimonas_sp.AAC.1